MEVDFVSLAGRSNTRVRRCFADPGPRRDRRGYRIDAISPLGRPAGQDPPIDTRRTRLPAARYAGVADARRTGYPTIPLVVPVGQRRAIELATRDSSGSGEAGASLWRTPTPTGCGRLLLFAANPCNGADRGWGGRAVRLVGVSCVTDRAGCKGQRWFPFCADSLICMPIH